MSSDWPYGYTLGSLTLADVADLAVVTSEGGGAWDESTFKIPGQDGRRNDPAGTRGPMDLDLVLQISGTDKDGDVTATDGEAGHRFENLSLIKSELASRRLVALGRTAPYIGEVRAMVKLFTRPIRQTQITYRFPLTAPSGSWQDATETTETAANVETDGDTWIHDPTIVLPAAGTLTHTTTGGVVSRIIGESGPTYPVTVFLDETTGRWRAIDDNGVDARGPVYWTQRWVLALEPDTEQNFTGNATIRWRNRWA